MIDFASNLQIALDFFNTSLGVLSFILLYAFWVIFLLPGLWLTMFAGVVYGSLYGSIIVFLGAILGADITFFLGRKFLRNWTQRRIAKFPKFQIVEKAITQKGLRLIFLTRLSPAFPFSLLNLFYGLTEVSFGDFSIGMIAIIPGTILYCSLGNFAGDIAKFDDVLSNRSDLGSLAISCIGLIATFAVFWLLSTAARKAIQEFDNSF